MIRGIDHIDLAVNDVERTVQIFLVMGFEVVSRNDHHNGTVEMKLPGPNQPVFDVHPVTHDHLDGKTGVVHIAFKVDDAHKAYEELKQKGVVFADGTMPHAIKSTGRLLFSIHEPSPDASAIGTCYVQFVDPTRKQSAA